MLLAALVYPCYRDRSFDLRAKPVGDPRSPRDPNISLYLPISPYISPRSPRDLPYISPVGDPSTSATVRLGDLVALCATLGERNCDYSLGKIA